MASGCSTWRRCVASGNSKASAFGSQASKRSHRSRKTGMLRCPLTAYNTPIKADGIIDERRMEHPGGVVAAERPPLHGREFLAEERVGVADGLLERVRQGAFECVAVLAAADTPHPGVDGSPLVAGGAALECGRDERPGQLRAEGVRPCWDALSALGGSSLVFRRLFLRLLRGTRVLQVAQDGRE
jgi:hypothetical protein